MSRICSYGCDHDWEDCICGCIECQNIDCYGDTDPDFDDDYDECFDDGEDQYDVEEEPIQ